MRRYLLPALAIVLLAGIALPSAAQAQATRTWVSGVGDDVNPCSRTAPCKTFAGAISKTAAGGEINPMDSGGFGGVTITKSITIDGTGYQSGILHYLTSGIIVNGANIDVTLRGLSLNGAVNLAACAPVAGRHGIRLVNARTLRLENLNLQSFETAGLQLEPSAANTRVLVDDVSIGRGCGPGVNAAPTGAGSLEALVSDTTIFGTTAGVRVASGARVGLAGTTIFDNLLGLETLGTGIIDSYGGNVIARNGTDGLPTNVINGEVPPPPPSVAPTSVVQEKKPVVATCKVPKLTGLSPASARAKLAKAGCAKAGVKRRKAAKARRGVKRADRVVAQSVKAGAEIPKTQRISLSVQLKPVKG